MDGLVPAEIFVCSLPEMVVLLATKPIKPPTPAPVAVPFAVMVMFGFATDVANWNTELPENVAIIA